MSEVSLFNTTRFTALASGDVIAMVDISDLTQSAHGSVDSITITNFFATVPVPVNITSASATSLAVGRLGATTPAFTVDSSTGSQVAGLKVTGAVTGGTVALVVTDSGSDASVTFNAKGTGTIGIGSASTGRVTITPVTTITGSLTLSAALVYGGVTLTNAVTGTGSMVLSAGPTLTGTTGMAGATFSTSIISTTALATPGALSATQFTAFASTVSGAALMGYGTTNDVTLMNRAGTVVLGVTANTANVTVAGQFDFVTKVVSTTALATPGALAATTLNAFASTVSGAAVMGFGTTTDVALMNRSGTVVMGVKSNTVKGYVNELLAGATSQPSAQLSTTHDITNSSSSAATLNITNTNAGAVLGLGIEFTGVDPNTTTSTFWECYGTTTLRAEMRTNGGLANFSANNANLSDERLKTDIRDLESQWDKFAKLRVVRGKFKDQTHGDDNYMGIAQQVGTIWPELMDDADPKRLGIYETDLDWIARAVLQECQQKIETLEQKLAALAAL